MKLSFASRLQTGSAGRREWEPAHTFKAFPKDSIFGFGVLKLAFGKITRFSSIIVALMTDTIPLTPSRCPKLDLAEPTKTGSSGFARAPTVAANAAASIGSPRLVPVQWPYDVIRISNSGEPIVLCYGTGGQVWVMGYVQHEVVLRYGHID